jgi:hypothetical protein
MNQDLWFGIATWPVADSWSPLRGDSSALGAA